MSGSEIQKRWLETVVEQLCAREGVEQEVLKDGRTAFKISQNGKSRRVFLAAAESDFRTQKVQYSQMRKALSELGIAEGQEYVPARRPRRPMSAEMHAARSKQQKEFEAWQELWRTIRKAENALDVEYEISQMWDYY